MGRAALVLTGGGARAAYQAGVLHAVARIRGETRAPRANPFPIITGSSAGAINAVALAARSDDFDGAARALAGTWGSLNPETIYRADAWSMLRTGARWLSMLTMGWAMADRIKPSALLDNAPLADLIDRIVRFERIPDLLRAGHVQALAVTASSYGSGHNVTFYTAQEPVLAWRRSLRMSVSASITRDHLMASAAIPFVFPAAALEIEGGRQWFGDGSMRQAAPISPAIHLGAERVFVVGSGPMREPWREPPVESGYPSIAQIGGHALSSIFLDSLAADVERLERINRTVALLSAEAAAKSPVKRIEVLVIEPSERIDDIAARHVRKLPSPLRVLLGGIGVRSANGREASGTALASYLLFEPGFLTELIALGERDALARREDIARFFGWNRQESPAPVVRLAALPDRVSAAS
ncbi:MAG TPA: patatin-like phospholipase family protein [Usitatibacter sp.]|nr:patatin-like phospholipase family protein [Usitatibacter sp.]